MIKIVDEFTLAKALHEWRGHKDTHPDFRGCSACTPDTTILFSLVPNIHTCEHDHNRWTCDSCFDVYDAGYDSGYDMADR